MPLTPCHAAAAWPLVRFFRLPVAAVVIGSMAPDFEYLLRLRPSGNFGHTLPGIALFCVPVGLLVWAVFTRVVRPWLVELVPLSREGWAEPARWKEASSLQRLALVVAGIVVGALSHMTWDAFTHESGWGVALVPPLANLVALPATALSAHVYTLLQHTSTLVGGVIVLAWVGAAVARHRTAAFPLSSWRRRRLTRAATILLAAVIFGAAVNGQRAWNRGLHHFLAHAAVGGMVAVAVTLVALASAARTRRTEAQREATG